MSTATTTLTEALDANFSRHSLSASPVPSTRPPLPSWKAPPPTQEEVEWADILTVDLSLYETDKSKLIETVQTALQRDGFFYIIGHGIDVEEVSTGMPESKCANMETEMQLTFQLNRQFAIGQVAFDQVPREEKEEHRAQIKEKGSFMGYKVCRLRVFWSIYC